MKILTAPEIKRHRDEQRLLREYYEAIRELAKGYKTVKEFARAVERDHVGTNQT